MKKIVAGITSLLLAAGGVALVAAPASAHTPSVSDTCNSITVDLQHYQTIAGSAEVLGERPLISAAVEGQDAVYAVEYEFVHKNENHPNSPRWEPEGWNADSNPNSVGWTSTGVTRQGALISAAVEAKDAVYGDAPVIQAAVAANATPNVVTVEVDGNLVVDTTFGNSYNNTIAIDGTKDHTYKVRVRAFDDPNGYNGWSFNHNGDTTKCAPVVTYPPVITPAAPSFTTAPTCDTDGTYALPEGPAAQNHNPAAGLYGVELDGYHLYVRNTTGDFGGPGVYTWDAYGIGANGNAAYPKGTSVGGKVDGQGNPKAGGKVSGTFEVLPATGDCPVVITPANPQAAFEAICGAADLTLTNPGETNLTASFVVNVDGEFYGAYAVLANGSETVNFTFAEDSGTHNIQVFQAGTSEWKEIANAEVPSDCELPLVVEPPVVKPPVVTPPVVDEPAVQAAAVIEQDGLAETGLGAWIWAILAAGIAALGAGAWFRFRPQHNN